MKPIDTQLVYKKQIGFTKEQKNTILTIKKNKMKYILQINDKYSVGEKIQGLYESKLSEVQIISNYKEYMLKKANEMNIDINTHWLNIMEYSLNNHLSKDEYNRISKEWFKLLDIYTLQYYIENILKCKRIEYKILSL